MRGVGTNLGLVVEEVGEDGHVVLDVGADRHGDRLALGAGRALLVVAVALRHHRVEAAVAAGDTGGGDAEQEEEHFSNDGWRQYFAADHHILCAF